jgi:hypothetical protein
MENRGTGLTPRKPPSPWERKPLELGKEADQGAMKTGTPTTRSMDRQPNDVQQMFDQAGNYVGQILTGRPGMQPERATPATNQGDTGGFGAEDLDHTTGKPTKGETLPRGSF